MIVSAGEAWIDWKSLNIDIGTHQFALSIYYPAKTASGSPSGVETPRLLIAQGNQTTNLIRVNFTAAALQVVPYDVDENGDINRQETLLLDADEDGMANLAEILAGGNPNNPGPTFLSAASVEVAERQKVSNRPNYIVYRANAISPRADTTMNFTLIPNGFPFVINEQSGELYLDARAAVEWPVYDRDIVSNNIYPISILASDGTISSQLALTLNITDVFNLNASAEVNTLHFRWEKVLDQTNNDKPADYYKLLENPDGQSGFVEVIGGARIEPIDQPSEITHSHKISVHKLHWLEAQYQVVAYRAKDPADTSSIGDTVIQKSEAFFATDLLFKAVAYVKSPDTAAGDNFGNSVSVSADGLTLAVGAYLKNSFIGSVYLYTRTIASPASDWTYVATLLPTNFESGETFGSSVSLNSDGSVIAVGGFNAKGTSEINTQCGGVRPGCIPGSGVVYVFDRPFTGWSGGANASPAYIMAPNAWVGDQFGFSVSLSDDGLVLAVSALLEDNAATTPMGAGNECTSSAQTSCSIDSGAVYVFERLTRSPWPIGTTNVAYLKAPNAGYNDRFGNSVSLSGDGNVVAVGAIYENNDANGVVGSGVVDVCTENGGNLTGCAFRSGAVYVFEKPATGNWRDWDNSVNTVSYIKAHNASIGDSFGYSVSLTQDGGVLAVGAPYRNDYSTLTTLPVCTVINENECVGGGAIYVFERPSSGKWQSSNQESAYLKAPGGEFGTSVSISQDGGVLVGGAPLKNNAIDRTLDRFNTCSDSEGGPNCIISSGAIYIIKRPTNGDWFGAETGNIDSNVNFLVAPNSGAQDKYGASVSISGDGGVLAVGAFNEGSDLQTAAGIPIQPVPTEQLNGKETPVVNNNADGAGAVYIY